MGRKSWNELKDRKKGPGRKAKKQEPPEENLPAYLCKFKYVCLHFFKWKERSPKRMLTLLIRSKLAVKINNMQMRQVQNLCTYEK